MKYNLDYAEFERIAKATTQGKDFSYTALKQIFEIEEEKDWEIDNINDMLMDYFEYEDMKELKGDKGLGYEDYIELDNGQVLDTNSNS